jgi:phosphoribosyl-AMP cyclohydrolase
MTEPFASPGTRAEVEEGARLTPRFGPDGLVACIAVDAGDGRVLMLAHMNAEALARTLETGEASGQIQRVVEMRVDCDQDALLIRVEVGGDGGCCHTGRRSCFYRVVERDPTTGAVTLAPADPDR